MEIQTYEWHGPDDLAIQRSLTGSMWIQVGAGLVFLNERQVRALRPGLNGLLELIATTTTALCWNCGETDPEYVSDTCSRCGVQT